MTLETWVTAFGYPRYEINIFGDIRHKVNKRILKQFPDRYGYMRVSLGNVDNVYVHRLMCLSFYGEPKSDSTQVNHIDGNRANNHIFNLEWCTPSQNIKWSISHGNANPDIGLRRAREVNLKPVRLIENGKEFSSVKDCAEFLGVNPNAVSRCLVGARKGQRLHGYHIEYV